MNSEQSKLFRLVTNLATVKMGAFLDGFSELFGGLVESLQTASSDPDASSDVAAVRESVADELSESFRAELSDLRKSVDESFAGQADVLFEQIGEETSEELFALVDRHDFALPKLYDELEEEDISAYMLILERGDAEFLQLIDLIETTGGVAGPEDGAGAECEDEYEYWQSLDGVESIDVHSDGRLIKSITDESDLFVIVAALRAQIRPVETPIATDPVCVCTIRTESDVIEARVSRTSASLLGRTFEIPEEVSWLIDLLTSEPTVVE